MRILQPRHIPLSIAKDQLKTGFLSPDTNEKYDKFSYEMTQRFAGPMPAKQFILAFLPFASPCDDKMPPDCTALKALFLSGATSIKEMILEGLVSC